MLHINKSVGPSITVTRPGSRTSTLVYGRPPVVRRESWPAPTGAFNTALVLPAPSRPLGTPRLQAGRWSPHNRAFLNAWMAKIGAQPNGMVAPAAVFDWDETSFVGDTINTWIYATLQNVALSLSPEQLADTLHDSIGTRLHFANGMHIGDLRADILDAYAKIWPLMQSGQGKAARSQAAYRDFRTKMASYYTLYYFDADNQVARDNYTWLKWFQGMPRDKVGEAVVAAYKTFKSSSKPTRTWAAASQGRTGKLQHTFHARPAHLPEIADLMRCLRRTGVEVYVISASISTCVEALAKHLGYPLAADSIYGSRAEFDAQDRLTGRVVSPDIFPIVFKEGKSECIKRVVKRAPLLVAGDSDGDVHMMTHFPQTQVRLVIDQNRRRGAITELYKAAQVPPQAQIGARTLLQAFPEPTSKVER